MITFETFDDENNTHLPQECSEDITAILNQYGFVCCDIDEDTITFIQE